MRVSTVVFQLGTNVSYVGSKEKNAIFDAKTAEADSCMFSMFGRTVAPQKGPTRGAANYFACQK